MMFRYSILVLFLTVAGCDQQATAPEQVYPWQITRLADGGSRVFGLSLNQTTLDQARLILGNHYEEGLFVNPDGSLSLEIYFNEVTLGGLSGKFILTLEAPVSVREAMRQRAVKGKRMDSGAVRYRLAGVDRERLLTLPIRAISYIPYVELDETLVRQRFGIPHDIIVVAEGKRHLLYPDKGLDLLLDEEGKELLQYVAPRDFSSLQRPLLSSPGS